MQRKSNKFGKGKKNLSWFNHWTHTIATLSSRLHFYRSGPTWIHYVHTCAKLSHLVTEVTQLLQLALRLRNEMTPSPNPKNFAQASLTKRALGSLKVSILLQIIGVEGNLRTVVFRGRRVLGRWIPGLRGLQVSWEAASFGWNRLLARLRMKVSSPDYLSSLCQS